MSSFGIPYIGDNTALAQPAPMQAPMQSPAPMPAPAFPGGTPVPTFPGMNGMRGNAQFGQAINPYRRGPSQFAGMQQSQFAPQQSIAQRMISPWGQGGDGSPQGRAGWGQPYYNMGGPGGFGRFGGGANSGGAGASGDSTGGWTSGGGGGNQRRPWMPQQLQNPGPSGQTGSSTISNSPMSDPGAAQQASQQYSPRPMGGGYSYRMGGGSRQGTFY